MTTAPYVDIFQECFNNVRIENNIIAKSILFNPNNKHVVSGKYLDFIEASIEEKDLFRSIITQLSDSNRLISVNSPRNSNSIDTEFEFLSKQTNDLFLPIAFSIPPQLRAILPKVSVVSSSVKPNRDWIITELLTKSNLIVSYTDFTTNSEINTFIENVLNLSNVADVNIFDRDNTTTHKKTLKGKRIHYHTLVRKNTLKHDKDSLLKELQRDLGSLTRLYFTFHSSLLHERKIIMSGLLITADNCFDNITCSDPTWQITVEFDSAKASKWLSKKTSFIRHII